MVLFPHITERFGGKSIPVVMLRDAAYPLLPWLMMLYPENQHTTPAQHTFSKYLSGARVAVERAFRRRKERWQFLMKRCDCNINDINTVVSACCVLHNFCEENFEDCDCTDVLEVEECNDFCGLDIRPGPSFPVQFETEYNLIIFYVVLVFNRVLICKVLPNFLELHDRWRCCFTTAAVEGPDSF